MEKKVCRLFESFLNPLLVQMVTIILVNLIMLSCIWLVMLSHIGHRRLFYDNLTIIGMANVPTTCDVWLLFFPESLSLGIDAFTNIHIHIPNSWPLLVLGGVRDFALIHYPSCTDSIKPSLQFSCNFVVINASEGSLCFQIFLPLWFCVLFMVLERNVLEYDL
jgi:hypothetical protein